MFESRQDASSQTRIYTVLYMYRYSQKSTRAGQGSLYNNVIDNILFSLPKVVNVGLEALGHEIVCDLLVVALVNVRRRYSHDLGALGCVLNKKINLTFPIFSKS